MKTNKFAYALVLLVAASLLIAACGKTDSTTSNTAGTLDEVNAPGTLDEVVNAPGTLDEVNTPGTLDKPSTTEETNEQQTEGFQNTNIQDTKATDTLLDPDVAQAEVPEEQKKCVVNADCMPKPECHPLECINKQFASQYTKPATCSAGLFARAAESISDCSCNNGLCKNDNNIV